MYKDKGKGSGKDEAKSEMRKKSQRDDMIIEKNHNTRSNPVGVKYNGNNENMSPLRS